LQIENPPDVDVNLVKPSGVVYINESVEIRITFNSVRTILLLVSDTPTTIKWIHD